MRVGVTGATGFLGRYIVSLLAEKGHECRCWYRMTSDRGGFGASERAITWVPGSLKDRGSAADLVQGCDAIVHAALDRPSSGFRGAEGDLEAFVEVNVVGTIRLIEAARTAGVGRFVFISTCAVHEVILDDRPLDETHPLWPNSHYGAHKAALEAFVHSYGLGHGYPICALRPTGIYGLAHPARESKWYDLVRKVVRGEDVECKRGGKEVHAADVARAVEVLLRVEGIAGQSYNCCDRSISQHEVATLARAQSGGRGQVLGSVPSPKHQIATAKLQALGMQFGGRPLLERTVQELVEAVRRE
jgi:nucleoside-diphosphate-sugar epimerase